MAIKKGDLVELQKKFELSYKTIPAGSKGIVKAVLREGFTKKVTVRFEVADITLPEKLVEKA